ncbi:timeless protein-domain-containing protein [Dichotomocladium elegans]|nr:timeless protein-domain-containing protein [Dichotomocladium elegans]
MEDDDAILQQNRNYILATCTALGGFEEKEIKPGVIEQIYTLGDEALGCLKDLKKAIRAESNSPFKTFLPALADFSVLENDLIPIIKLHATDPSEIAERFILACVELLVPMTWPLEQQKQNANDDDDEEDEYDPNLLNRYRRYKLALLQPGLFEAVMRLLVGPMSTPYHERSMRDQIVIRLVLYLFRNLSAIPDLNASQAASEETLQMASMQEKLLVRFCETELMDLLLVIASNSAEQDAAEWNVIVLEILYNLLQGVSAREVFHSSLSADHDRPNRVRSDKLDALLKVENDVKRLKIRSAPSRHQRFGGSYAIKSWDGETRVSHKQDSAYLALGDIIDNNKKPDRRGLKRKEREEGLRKTYTTLVAMRNLKQLAQSFLKNSFNAFYLNFIKEIAREDKKITEKDHVRFYHTMAWFLEYFSLEHAAAAKERQQGQQKQINPIDSNKLFLPTREAMEALATSENTDAEKQQNQEPLSYDYDLVASVMDLRAFLLCIRRLTAVTEEKNWREVRVTANCFKQLVVTVSAMSSAPQEEFRDVAEYIQSNIYHEQSTLDLFTKLICKYTTQSLGYLKTVVELTHVMLKLLEHYSSKNQFMFVRKKAKKKRKEASVPEERDPNLVSEPEDEEREENVAYRQHVFKFDQFEKKYLRYDVVRVYCMLLEHFEVLEPHIIHCITSLFHRIMVRRKNEQIFFKLPVLELFNRILAYENSLSKTPENMELLRFIRYCIHQFFKRLEEYPPLFMEVLFHNPKSK